VTDPHTSRMPALSDTPDSTRRGSDLASVLAALRDDEANADGDAKRLAARAHRRGVLTLVMIVLLVGAVIQLSTSTPETRPPAETGSRASIVFGNAGTGTCLGWPPDAPDKPSFVQCRSDHMFEVAKPVGMNSFGEPCQLAVREYLGTHYDPNSRFTISVLWAGDADGTNAGGRNLLCGLQLLGPGGKPIPFKGRIVDLDQSKVWPSGTCLGINSSNRSTDIPVDCSAPHALEVTGSVGLAERFTSGVPSDGEQRAFLGEACTRAADGYLAPASLARSGLTLAYDTVAPASWAAGSRQVSCNVGRPAEAGWTPMTGTVRTQSLADVPPPAAPPPPSPSSEPPPPPVYEEPLIPVGPLSSVPSPTPAPSATPSAPPTTTTATAVPTETSAPASTTASPGPPPPLGPAPGPATPPSETTSGPQPGVLEIPGLPAITLPGFAPAEPAPAG
jgi:predicted heme/steroid binding protein